MANSLQSLKSRFGYSPFHDPQSAHFKLTQQTSASDYRTQFESLSNRIIGLPANTFLSCCISGPKLHIRREVHALQPMNFA